MITREGMKPGDMNSQDWADLQWSLAQIGVHQWTCRRDTLKGERTNWLEILENIDEIVHEAEKALNIINLYLKRRREIHEGAP